jgi:hypothetical protein
MSDSAKQPQKRWPLGNYGLTIVLAVLFLSTWVGQFFTELSVFKQEASQHGESFEWSGFWPEFWQSTLENWQSEFLQLLTFVVLTAFLIHRGSAESKDSDEDMQAALARIEARLDRMEGSSEPAHRGNGDANHREAAIEAGREVLEGAGRASEPQP